MEEYPSANDYREIIEEFIGRDDTQAFLQDKKHYIVHTDTKEKLADVSRRIFFGHELTTALRDGALEYDAETKSTAFSIYSKAYDEDLLADLQTSKDDETIFDNKKQLRVQNASETDEGIEITVEYVRKRIGRRELVSEDEKDTSVIMVETDHDDVRTVKQSYERIDEYNAISSFFENWNTKRRSDDKEEIKRYNISIQRLPISERISLFDDLMDYNPGNWVLEDVLQLGVKQGEDLTEVFEDVEDEEDIADEIDENLEGITDAILTGEGLQANSFVQKCRENGYYFKSTKLYYDNVDVAEKVEILIEFKEGARNTFDVSVVQGHEKKDGRLLEQTFDSERENQIRDQIRNMVIDTYSQYLEPIEIRQEEISSRTLSDIKGISDRIIQNLKAMGYESIEDVRGSTVEELQKVPSIGEEKAKRLVES